MANNDNLRPRQTDKPRLAAIDPEQLSRDISEHLAAWLGRLAVRLSPGLNLHGGELVGDTGYGITAADLCRYAQTGAPLDDRVEDYVLPLTDLLEPPVAPWSGPLPSVLTAWLEGDVDLSKLRADSIVDQLALVVVAAIARQDIEDGAPVSVGRLAALGGLDPRSVRRLVQSGELPGEGDPLHVPAEAARRWLRGRGVVGC